MSIHFDMEETQNILEPIEKNYLEFLELSDSFLGWLLTLSEEEFRYVYKNVTHNYRQDPQGGISFLFTQVELIHKGVSIMLLSELEEDIKRKRFFTLLIQAVKKKLVRYKVGKTDMEWKFEVTEEGKLVADLGTTIKALRDGEE